MMKSRPSLKSLVKGARNSLIFIVFSLFILGCSSSLHPTYHQENIEQSIQNICKKEYSIDVTATRVGSTVWIYMPLEDIFEKSDKPEKYSEKFNIDRLNTDSEGDTLHFEYLVKVIPETEKAQEYKYKKDTVDKINNAWKVLRRVIFSLDRSKEDEPQFYCLITADIKNGLEITELFYYLDLKKVSYEYISWGEYQHRTIQDTGFGVQIIGDKEGKHINYRDITMKDFVVQQILHRIKLKFQKPEVDKNADVDKEIIKIIHATVSIYGFKDFDFLELVNLDNNNKLLLSRASLLESFRD